MPIVRTARAVVVTCALVVGAAAMPSAALAANPEGQLDTSFSGDGLASVSPFDGFESFVRQPDGTFIAAWGTDANPKVMRLTAAGTLDTTFGGGDGVAEVPLAHSATYAVAVQPDGRILVGGTGDIFSTRPGFVARLLPNGSMDTSFSGDGIVTLSLPGYNAGEVYEIGVDRVGRIVAAGDMQTPAGNEMALVRLTGAGALDTSFGGDGYVMQTYTTDGFASEVAFQADGRIVMLGGTYNQDGIWAARFNDDGSPDTGFLGGGGVVPLGVPSSPGELRLDDEGRIVGVSANATSILVWRQTSTGALDDTFGGGDGIFSGDAAFGFNDASSSGTIEPNGRIVVAGAEGNDLVLFRLLPTGVPDPTFATDGRQQTTATADTPHLLANVQLDDRGRIFAMGATNTFTAGIAAYVGDATKPFGARVFAGASFATSSRSIRWTASDDNTGIKNYDVRYRAAAYSSSTLGSATGWKTNTVATSASFAGSAGRTYCFDARADDNAGNVSNYSPAACIAFPLDDRSLTRAGSWTSVSQSSSYKGTLSRSTSSGATLKKTGVRYRKLAVVATTCSGCGKVSVYLGSTKLATIDLNSGTTKRRVVFLVDTSATVKSGTVTIKQVSGGKPVLIDGLGVSLY